VEGTKAVLGACKEEGVQKLVLTSSTASIFCKTVESGYEFTEGDWRYGEEKDETRVQLLLQGMSTDYRNMNEFAVKGVIWGGERIMHRCSKNRSVSI
tara:strand:+ start:707 stop:997 length:291 start_codon:yes stop_codon:yes gene_type:complete